MNDEFNKLDIQVDGATLARVSPFATLYFRGGCLLENRELIGGVFQQYYKRFIDHLTHLRHPHTEKWTLIEKSEIDSITVWLTEQNLNMGYELNLQSSDLNLAPEYGIEVLCSAHWQYEMGHVDYIRWWYPSDETLAEDVLATCNLLKPLHGYAGFGLIECYRFSLANSISKEIYALARRFPTLEIDRPPMHVPSLESGAKGVNWLTILCDDLVPSGLLDGISQDITVYSYSGGLVLKVGEEMVLESEPTISLETYRDLWRRLDSIIVKMNICFYEELPEHFSREESLKWLRRFS
ncbi:MAG: type VI immunity family protein [Akkermansiaceae bacterium]